jgi:hypothetical protein
VLAVSGSSRVTDSGIGIGSNAGRAAAALLPDSQRGVKCSDGSDRGHDVDADEFFIGSCDGSPRESLVGSSGIVIHSKVGDGAVVGATSVTDLARMSHSNDVAVIRQSPQHVPHDPFQTFTVSQMSKSAAVSDGRKDTSTSSAGSYVEASAAAMSNERKDSEDSHGHSASVKKSPSAVQLLGVGQSAFESKSDDLTVNGLSHLLSNIEFEIKRIPSGRRQVCYRELASSLAKGIVHEITCLANRGSAMPHVSLASMCDVVVDQLPTLCAVLTSGGGLLNDRALDNLTRLSHMSQPLSEDDVRQQVHSSCVGLWDRMQFHLSFLVKRSAMTAVELAAIFAPMLISPHSHSHHQAENILFALLETVTVDELPSPTSTSDFSFASSPRKPIPEDMTPRLHEAKSLAYQQLLGNTGSSTINSTGQVAATTTGVTLDRDKEVTTATQKSPVSNKSAMVTDPSPPKPIAITPTAVSASSSSSGAKLSKQTELSDAVPVTAGVSRLSLSARSNIVFRATADPDLDEDADVEIPGLSLSGSRQASQKQPEENNADDDDEFWS